MQSPRKGGGEINHVIFYAVALWSLLELGLVALLAAQYK